MLLEIPEWFGAEQYGWFITAILVCALSYVIAHVGSSFFNYLASRNISFHLNKEVATQIAKDIQKGSLFASIKKWWKSHRDKKKVDDPYSQYITIPIEEV